jgi:hypothetical protein
MKFPVQQDAQHLYNGNHQPQVFQLEEQKNQAGKKEPMLVAPSSSRTKTRSSHFSKLILEKFKIGIKTSHRI